MSDNQTAAKPKVQRLSPNARAQLISEYNAGKELSNPDYYIIKNKDGKLNVRRKREKSLATSKQSLATSKLKTTRRDFDRSGRTEKNEEQTPIPTKEEEVKEEPAKKPKAL